MAEMSQAAKASSQANPMDEKTIYEVGFHVVSTTPEEEVGAVAERVRGILSKAGAEIISEGVPQKMTLAYTIERPVSGGKNERHNEAYFGWFKFEVDTAKANEIQDALRGMRDILRFIFIETVREDISAQTRRAVFSSDRLEGKTIEKRPDAPEEKGQVSDEELNKSIEALVQ